MKFSWQLTKPVEAVVFDCDGTLSHLEGINELAEQNGVGEIVELLTTKAMEETGITTDLYEHRISLVKPSRQQLVELGQNYFIERAPDIVPVIEALKEAGKSIYIMSAGLNPAVKNFGEFLGVDKENIFAVDTIFDKEGNYQDYDRNCPLVSKGGKREIINRIKSKHERLVHIGDGMNDLEAHDLVTRFIGYGGAFYRESIARLCQFYIKSATLSPLLPLSLTEKEAENLSAHAKKYYFEGLDLVDDHGVVIHLPIRDES